MGSHADILEAVEFYLGDGLDVEKVQGLAKHIVGLYYNHFSFIPVSEGLPEDIGCYIAEDHEYVLLLVKAVTEDGNEYCKVARYFGDNTWAELLSVSDEVIAYFPISRIGGANG